jgi:hypothetical protein
MGLLDNLFNTEQGRMGLGLLAAGSARGDGAGFGQRLSEAVGSVDQWKQQQAQAKRAKMQEEYQAFQMQQAMAQAEQQKAEQAQMKALIAQYRTPAVVPGQAGTGGTSMVNSALPEDLRIGAQAPLAARPAGFDREGFGAALEGVNPMKGLEYLASIQKDNTPISVAKDTTLLDKRTFKTIFAAPKSDSSDAKIQQYEYAVKNNGYKGTLADFISIAPNIMANAQAPLRNAQVSNIYEENAYNLPPPRKPSGGPVTVMTPQGTFSFPNQAAANSFKMKAGIK